MQCDICLLHPKYHLFVQEIFHFDFPGTRLCLRTGWLPVATGPLLEGWGLFQLQHVPRWHKTGILTTKPDFSLLLHPYFSTTCTLAPVRSPHCFASKFSSRAAKFLTWRKNKGLKKCGQTMKHLNNTFSESQALGTCHTKCQHRHISSSPVLFQNYLKDM